MKKTPNQSEEPQRAAPWWLHDRQESCPHCLQSYAHGLHYHCSACDGESCGLCIVTVSVAGEVHHCPDCAGQEEDG